MIAPCGCTIRLYNGVPGVDVRCAEGQQLHDDLASLATHSPGYSTARRAYAAHIIAALDWAKDQP